MTTLLLARHGETVWHAENRYAGSSDVGLTDLGHAQARALAVWASSQPIAAVCASDLSRAILTATPAAQALGVSLQIDSRLREVDFGRGEGMTRAEMMGVFPGAVEDFLRHPARVPLPDGESGVDAIDRAWPALEQIATDHDGETVLIVMHSTLMRLILCRVLDMPPDRYRTAFPSVRNAAITTVSMGRGVAALHGYNVPTEHLGRRAAAAE